MALNGRYALSCRKDVSFGANCTSHQQKCRPMTLVSGNVIIVIILLYADIRDEFGLMSFDDGRGHQMTVGLSLTEIFGDLDGYFF